ncbi:MAG TPA: SpoIIE family protein phosphatase, partial [Ignavibacteriaceae bacterium]
SAAAVFKQLINLGIEPNRIYIAIIKDEKGFCDFWITDEDGSKVSSGFEANLNDNSSFKKMFEGWKNKEKSMTIDMQGEELQEYFNHLTKLGVPFKGGLLQKRRLQYIAYFSNGFIGVASPDQTKPETVKLLERFAAVFNLTYTRFNDLLQAEAQNRIIQAENERKSKELEDARQLQLSMLPKELPQLPHLDIAVYMKTATEVGGDYYDYIVDSDGTLTFVVGDATGHGMMSGMMVSIMKSFFISNKSNLELKTFFENANNSIKDMQLGRLMMACVGVQITPDKIIATNAGMPSLIYFRNKSQKAGEFVSHNFPLGGMKGTIYSLKEIKYEKGDILLLMSDGFAELKNDKNEQYGYPRITNEFKSVVHKSSNEIVDHLNKSASKWISGTEPDDDITFVVIKVK